MLRTTFLRFDNAALNYISRFAVFSFAPNVKSYRVLPWESCHRRLRKAAFIAVGRACHSTFIFPPLYFPFPIEWYKSPPIKFPAKVHDAVPARTIVNTRSMIDQIELSDQLNDNSTRKNDRMLDKSISMRVTILVTVRSSLDAKYRNVRNGYPELYSFEKRCRIRAKLYVRVGIIIFWPILCWKLGSRIKISMENLSLQWIKVNHYNLAASLFRTGMWSWIHIWPQTRRHRSCIMQPL